MLDNFSTLKRRERQDIDWPLFSLYLGLIAIGWGMLYSVGHGPDGYTSNLSEFLLDTVVGKQTIWIGISLVTFAICLLIDPAFWRAFAYPVYGICVFLLLAVLLFGAEIKGATSWFRVGPFTFQPSELAKFGTALAIASYVSPKNVNLSSLRGQFPAFGILLLPMLLILLQPDPGSVLVFLGFGVALYREGFPGEVFAIAGALAALLLSSLVFEPLYVIAGLVSITAAISIVSLPRVRNWGLYHLGISATVGMLLYFSLPIFAIFLIGGLTIGLFYALWQRNKGSLATALFVMTLLGSALSFGTSWSFNNVLKPHQQARINVWLKPDLNQRGAAYNLIQSKLAIGSGGLTGKGFLEGEMTMGGFVPEQNTDFIFCTVGEEHGFVGVASVIGMFMLLMLRISQVAERQRTIYARAYAYGVLGIFFVHFLVNIGMTMGVMPIIGIPLPFISKGGSALVGFTLLIGVLIKIDSTR